MNDSILLNILTGVTARFEDSAKKVIPSGVAFFCFHLATTRKGSAK
jgi:hypothetical protein